MTDIHQKKIELDKRHLNKKKVQILQELTNVYILNITYHYIPKYFEVSDEKHLNKHILVLRRAKHHTSAFLIWRRLLIESFDF